jgi:transcriptional regulator with XRE-family HTH domain
MENTHPLKAFRLRQEPPLTQEQLADLLDTTKGTVSRWETGERKPDPGDVPAISAKTGIPPAQLRPDLAELFTARRSRSPARPRRAKAASRAA